MFQITLLTVPQDTHPLLQTWEWVMQTWEWVITVQYQFMSRNIQHKSQTLCCKTPTWMFPIQNAVSHFLQNPKVDVDPLLQVMGMDVFTSVRCVCFRAKSKDGRRLPTTRHQDGVWTIRTLDPSTGTNFSHSDRDIESSLSQNPHKDTDPLLQDIRMEIYCQDYQSIDWDYYRHHGM